jgi:hypothetical protein
MGVVSGCWWVLVVGHASAAMVGIGARMHNGTGAWVLVYWWPGYIYIGGCTCIAKLVGHGVNVAGGWCILCVTGSQCHGVFELEGVHVLVEACHWAHLPSDSTVPPVTSTFLSSGA